MGIYLFNSKIFTFIIDEIIKKHQANIEILCELNITSLSGNIH